MLEIKRVPCEPLTSSELFMEWVELHITDATEAEPVGEKDYNLYKKVFLEGACALFQVEADKADFTDAEGNRISLEVSPQVIALRVLYYAVRHKNEPYMRFVTDLSYRDILDAVGVKNIASFSHVDVNVAADKTATVSRRQMGPNTNLFLFSSTP